MKELTPAQEIKRRCQMYGRYEIYGSIIKYTGLIGGIDILLHENPKLLLLSGLAYVVGERIRDKAITAQRRFGR